MEETKQSHRLEWILMGVAVFLIAVLIGFSVLMYRSQRPMAQAQEEATELAQKYTDLATVDNFYWFTREETYFSLTGKDKKGDEIAVILPKEGNKIKVLKQADGITETQALRKTAEAYPDDYVTNARLGMFQEKPVWEVATTTENDEVGYVLLSFADGKEIKRIHGI
ncbi:cell wall elongation regulator TseB-like domain-containing protein [Enterococcus diestrammenae]|uniref:Cell wall elongation regulator TseB-like domain-containing protein n=1 Tax=Enterococcus diestrammenae TaxID=1155073 RepID=A0ABV0F394_9ENTE|nr:DUF5590 domain-containing protein [Enterococcus diestrammenae]KAF1300360.1 peptidase [Enterococcus diestrammenae]